MNKQGKLKKLAAAGAIALTLTGVFNAASRADSNLFSGPAAPQTAVDPEKAKKAAELSEKILADLKAFDDFMTNPENANLPDEQLKNRGNEAMNNVLSLLRQGADPNYIGKNGAPLLAWAYWMAYETDRPDVIVALSVYGANFRQSYPLNTPLPRAEQAAIRNMRLNPAAGPLSRISMADHAVIALMESQFMYARHIETAIAAIKVLQGAGVTVNDIAALRHPRIRSFADLALNPVGLSVMVDKGLAPRERLRALVDLDDATQRDVLAQQEVTPEFLRRYNAPLQSHLYPDAQPGGPEPYEVQQDDTVQSVARRFYQAMGAASPGEAARLIAQKNNIALPANDAAETVLEKGRTILLPTIPQHQIGQAGFGPATALLGAAQRLYAEMGAATPQEAFNTLRADNNIKGEADLEKFSAPGAVIAYTVKGETEKRSTTLRHDDLLRGIATGISDNAAVRGADGVIRQGGDVEAIMDQLALMNGFSREDFAAGRVSLKKDQMLWITYFNDNHLHMDELSPPSTYDPSNKVILFTIEPGSKTAEDKKSMHDKRTYGAASGTAYALNRGVDLRRIQSWDEAIFAYPGFKASPALRVLFNLAASPLQDRVIFSVSMAQPVAASQADAARMQRRPDETEFEFIRRFMDEMEKNRPIIFEAAGNWRQNAPGAAEGDGRYVQSYLLTHSPRAVNIGAKGFYPHLTPGNKSTISHYSSYAGDVCGELPRHLGDNQEGTSFSTPAMGALVRQFLEWYGNRLTFEEIMAAGMMTGVRDIMDFDPAGGNIRKLENGKVESVPAIFRVNGGGLPIHERCGAGGVDRHTARQWNEALKKMVEMKQEMQGGRYSSQFIAFGPAEVQEKDGAREYVYRVTVPKNLTLDKLTFLLPQFRGNHSDVQVKMPSGFDMTLPSSMHDVVSTRAFNYEDVRTGGIIEIRAKAPFGPHAGMYLRGHEDGNIIAKLRDGLRAEGVLHAPLQTLVGGRAVSDEEAKQVRDEREANRRARNSKPAPVSAPEMKLQ